MNLLTQRHIGELRLGASTTIAQYVLPPYLATFQQKFKQIKLSLINGNSSDIEKQSKNIVSTWDSSRVAVDKYIYITPLLCETNWFV